MSFPPTETTNQGTIVDCTSQLAGKALGRMKARLSRLNNKLSRVADVLALAPGVTVYRDTPPGVGWVLERKGYPKRYLRTKELAIEHWRRLILAQISISL